MTVAPPRPVQRDSYAALVRRTRRLVERWVPVGSTVAVLSRGDPAMVTFRDRVGWHLPCYDDGRYVGYHPADAADAVRAVDAVVQRGASHLVVPETSAWWLDHYAGLRAHLERTGSVVVREPGTATLFSMSPPAGEDPARALVAADLVEIVGLLLPPGVWLAVIGDETVARALGDRFRVVSVGPAVTGSDVLRGADFLVLPCAHYAWWRSRDDLRNLAGATRLVTWQEHVGAIFELLPPAGTDAA